MKKIEASDLIIKLIERNTFLQEMVSQQQEYNRNLLSDLYNRGAITEVEKATIHNDASRAYKWPENNNLDIEINRLSSYGNCLKIGEREN